MPDFNIFFYIPHAHVPHSTPYTARPTHTLHTALLTSHAPRTHPTQHSLHRTHHAHVPHSTPHIPNVFISHNTSKKTTPFIIKDVVLKL